MAQGTAVLNLPFNATECTGINIALCRFEHDVFTMN